MTNAQRQQRARDKRAAQGLAEVRGVYAPPKDHDRLRKLFKYHAAKKQEGKS